MNTNTFKKNLSTPQIDEINIMIIPIIEKYPKAYIEKATLAKKDKTPNAKTGEKSKPAIYVNLNFLKKLKYGSQSTIKILPRGVIKK